ncbi:MAG: hypothetical protein S4CHLAM123_07560 [Chlamydiales bacterium]|nr:hypothetical protein [Chlamydiales bacterium]
MSIESSTAINNFENEIIRLSQEPYIDSNINEAITTLVTNNLELINSSKNTGIKTALVTLSARFQDINTDNSVFFKELAENITVSKKRSRAEVFQNDSSKYSSASKKSKIDISTQTPSELLNIPKEIEGLTANIIARKEQGQIIELLDDLKGYICALNKNDSKPIQIDAGTERVEVSKVLHELEADINTPDEDGRTPLHKAIYSHDVEAIKIFYKLGADINISDKYGHTPVHAAAQTDHVESIETLFKLGANIDTLDKYGCTPLYEAVSCLQWQSFKLLLKLGADVKNLNKEELTRTLVFRLVNHIYNNDQEKLQLIKLIIKLIDLGADMNVKEASQSALDLLIEKENQIQRYRERGIEVPDKEGLEPILKRIISKLK